jgi:hypothetical protein
MRKNVKAKVRHIALRTKQWTKRSIADRENHVHLLNDKPLIGTSTVVGVIAKPLTWWASGLAVEEMGWQKKLDPRKFTADEVKLNARQRKLKAAVALREIEAMNGERIPSPLRQSLPCSRRQSG